MTPTGRPGRVTLEDVARQAGVSRALVSIVMRGVPGAGDATRERVLAVAAELGYRPDARARALAGQRSGLIGVMFGVGFGSFHFDLLEGLYAAAETHGLNLLLSAVTPGRDERAAALSLQDFSFDGLIMLGPPNPQPLLAGTVPVVVVGWHVDDPAVDVVRTSDAEGMADAIAHLVALGHRRIAHLDGGDGPIAYARRQAFLDCMGKAGLSGSAVVLPSGQTQLDGQRAARELWALPQRPSAVIAYNDDAAVGAMSHVVQRGVRVPDQLSIIGWDDNEAAALAPVPLTSVAQQPAELAERAVDRIVARMAQGSVEQGSVEQGPVEQREIVLAPVLRVRESTATPASS